jgi:hypothetical protein
MLLHRRTHQPEQGSADADPVCFLLSLQGHRRRIPATVAEAKTSRRAPLPTGQRSLRQHRLGDRIKRGLWRRRRCGVGILLHVGPRGSPKSFYGFNAAGGRPPRRWPCWLGCGVSRLDGGDRTYAACPLQPFSARHRASSCAVKRARRRSRSAGLFWRRKSYKTGSLIPAG